MFIESLPDGTLYLIGEGRALRFAHPLYRALLPLLDGQRSPDVLASELAGQGHDPAAVHFALYRLRERSLIFDAAVTPALKTACLYVVGDADPAPLRDRLILDAEGTIVVLTDDYRRPELAEINQQALRDRTPWWLVRLNGQRPWLGPYFVPGQSACWACLRERLSWNPRHEAALREQLARPDAVWPPPIVPAIAEAAAAMFLARFLAPAPTRCEIVVVDPRQLQSTAHHVVRRPQCPVCGDAERISRQQRAPLSSASVGTAWRSLSSEVVLSRLAHHVSPITGLVEVLQPLPEGTTPVVFAGRPRARRGVTRSGLPAMFEAANLGKGLTLEDAKVSALCEALERYATVFQGDEACHRASLNALGETALPPSLLQPFSDRQRQDRARWNRRAANIAHHVPEPLDPDEPISWTPAWSLNRAEPTRRWIPTALCFFRYPTVRFGRADSNGVAAGATLAEAIFQGLLELIERDAVAIWWYNRLRRPQLALDPGYRAGPGRRMWILDLRHDLGIPVCAAISANTRGGEILYGFGAHLDPARAMKRAVTELNQLAPVLARFQRGDFSPDSPTAQWFQDATLENTPHLTPEGWRDNEASPPEDLRADLQTVFSRLGAAGCTPYAVDLTRPDVALHVVRVIVPGLRHFWPRFGPGRLFTVPVQQGWRAAPIEEDALNPTPILF